MRIVIKANEKSSAMEFLGRVCDDLFPEGIFIEHCCGEPPVLVKYSDGKIIESSPHPILEVYLEVPLRIIQLSTTKKILHKVEQIEVQTFLAECSDQQRAEVEAMERITFASRNFSVIFLEMARYLPPQTE